MVRLWRHPHLDLRRRVAVRAPTSATGRCDVDESERPARQRGSWNRCWCSSFQRFYDHGPFPSRTTRHRPRGRILWLRVSFRRIRAVGTHSHGSRTSKPRAMQSRAHDLAHEARKRLRREHLTSLRVRSPPRRGSSPRRSTRSRRQPAPALLARARLNRSAATLQRRGGQRVAHGRLPRPQFRPPWQAARRFRFSRVRRASLGCGHRRATIARTSANTGVASIGSSQIFRRPLSNSKATQF